MKIDTYIIWVEKIDFLISIIISLVGPRLSGVMVGEMVTQPRRHGFKSFRKYKIKLKCVAAKTKINPIELSCS